ncbi:hypothetical protein CPER28S_02458 [Cellulomonas persica]
MVLARFAASLDAFTRPVSIALPDLAALSPSYGSFVVHDASICCAMPSADCTALNSDERIDVTLPMPADALVASEVGRFLSTSSRCPALRILSAFAPVVYASPTPSGSRSFGTGDDGSSSFGRCWRSSSSFLPPTLPAMPPPTLSMPVMARPPYFPTVSRVSPTFVPTGADSVCGVRRWDGSSSMRFALTFSASRSAWRVRAAPRRAAAIHAAWSSGPSFGGSSASASGPRPASTRSRASSMTRNSLASGSAVSSSSRTTTMRS